MDLEQEKNSIVGFEKKEVSPQYHMTKINYDSWRKQMDICNYYQSNGDLRGYFQAVMSLYTELSMIINDEEDKLFIKLIERTSRKKDSKKIGYNINAIRELDKHLRKLLQSRKIGIMQSERGEGI